MDAQGQKDIKGEGNEASRITLEEFAEIFAEMQKTSFLNAFEAYSDANSGPGENPLGQMSGGVTTARRADTTREFFFYDENGRVCVGVHDNVAGQSYVLGCTR